MQEQRTKKLKEQARALGFDACGVAEAGPIDPDDHLGAWLAAGYHADMEWLARGKAVRQNPALRLPGIRSVVAVAANYFAPRPVPPPGSGRVSRYAWGRDYHRALLKPLRALARWLDSTEAGAASYAEVDTGPVLERAWAARAGLGWIGKNGLLIHPEFGSWCFLGILFTTVELTPDAPIAEKCGECRACLKACPTGALLSPAVLDARRCIAYHTIENRGVIPAALQPQFGNWVFGCDQCQEVCPWNRRPQITARQDFLPRTGMANPILSDWMNLDEAGFASRFEGSPIRRATCAGLLRNARIAHANARVEIEAPRAPETPPE